MSDTLLRQWTMLRRIPRHPRKVTVAELLRGLKDQGFETSERTVQRDLVQLSGELFALTVDDRNRPHGWQWAQDAEPLDIPGMEPQTALAFKLAEYFLEPMMAPATLSALAPYFQQADYVMANSAGAINTWPDKVRAVTRGQTLVPPAVDAGVLRTVYDALFEDGRFTARYRRRYDGELKDYVVNPLGLVFRDGVIYLVCSLFDYEDVVLLVLHRMEHAEAIDETAHRPADFDLDTYLQKGGLDYRLGEGELDLKLLVEAETAVHLRETPLSRDQTMQASEDGDSVELRAPVADTLQLRWWILGLGPRAEVVEPAHLRQEIAEELTTAADRYL